ncbi:MAG: rhamnan synthesis F family protein [Candidatus Omnitrophica bacterium]|nr:rhamnan synthesis F family protein [Candidatus Omnitrophota bacterium]
MKNRLKSISGWHWGALGIIALFSALLIIRWQSLPVFLDIYYHAACMTGFKEAGGIALHDFWEYAPIGRPQLYPPFFHVILLALDNTGLGALFVMRFVSAAIYPLLLAVILWVVRRRFNDRLAFFTVLAASLPYTFFLNSISAVPSAIALIFFILLFYAIETRKILSGVLLLGLMFYTHGAIPWMAVLTLVIYAMLRRGEVKTILPIIAGGIILGSPWLIHMALNRSYFLTVNNYINRYFEMNLWLYAFTILGVLFVLKRRGRYLFYMAMFIGMLPMLKDYSFRFFCGEGLLPLIFLAGLGFDEAYSAITAFLRRRAVSPAIYGALLPWVIFYLATFYPPDIGSAFCQFSAADPKNATALESSIYMKKHMEELTAIIKATTRPDEIIYCNYNYVAGIFYVFSGRVSSSAMLNEVRPIMPESDPAASAALTIWIKNPEGVIDPEHQILVRRLGLEKIAETEIAYVYRNPVVMAHKVKSGIVLPAGAALAAFFVWAAAIVFFITRPARDDMARPSVRIVLNDFIDYPLRRRKAIFRRKFWCGIGCLLENMSRFKAGADFKVILVINSSGGPEMKEKKLLYSSLRRKYPFILDIIFRDNSGFDFGAYDAGYRYLKATGYSNDIIFMNSSAIGPSDDHWLSQYSDLFHDKPKNIGLCGISLNSHTTHLEKKEFKPHVQSFFIYTSMNVMSRVFGDSLAETVPALSEKLDIISAGEIGFSWKVIEAGYGITSKLFKDFVYYKDAEWTVPCGDMRFTKKYNHLANHI